MQNWKFCHKHCRCVHLLRTAESLLRIFFALNTFLVASLSFREVSKQAELQILDQNYFHKSWPVPLCIPIQFLSYDARKNVPMENLCR